MSDAGIKIVERAVGEVESHGGHVLVDGEPTGYLVAADGLHSPVRRMLGLDRPAGGRRRYGLRVHVEMAPWTPFVEVHWAEGSEAYVTPVADELVGIALLTERQATFDDLLAEHVLLKERLGRRPLSRTRGAGPLRQRSTARTLGWVLLVGDAAGYVDALTGEGIAIGLAQARAAVDAVVSGRPPAIGPDEGTLSVEVANAVYLSALTGSSVDLPLDADVYDDAFAKMSDGTLSLPT